ncbi:MAG: hypothetical protein KME47_26685 [Nodosilinea sp. WJT8-NPBG4]|nr:hypothetical protein [Nodosilinea sp. WJT8-NPBG4]
MSTERAPVGPKVHHILYGSLAGIVREAFPGTENRQMAILTKTVLTG